MKNPSPARACGIDFGTSNSTVGWIRPGMETLIALEDDKITLPSVVFFNFEERRPVYGRLALHEYLENYEGRLMRSLKSLLGSKLIKHDTSVLGTAMPFTDLLALFIGQLKSRAEATAGREFEEVVLGRPVFFVDDDPMADQEAENTLVDVARKIGFKDISFQYEPIAAAFDYESTIEKEELVLIVDIGGGTSDFSLVRLSPERAKKAERRDDILATGGVHIGGTDFDKYLSLSSVMPLLGYGSRLNNNSYVPSSYYFNLATWHTINLAYTKKIWVQLADVCRDAREQDKVKRLQKLIDERAGHWLAMKVEEGKIALSDAPQVSLDLDRLAPRQSLDIARSDFDAASGHLVDRIEATVSDMLRKAGVQAAQVDTVFFTGGSSGVLQLREKIAALLPDAKRVEGDLFGSIGAGLALDAARKFG